MRVSRPRGVWRTRATPRHPRSRMIRATRLREVRTPDRLSLRNTFGAPYMSRTSALTWDIIAASSSSRIACALGGRLFHAQWPWRVTLSAAHISDTGQAPSLREMNSSFALFADSPTAACWRRRRSLLKASRSRATRLRRSSAIWNGLSPVPKSAASAFLTQSERLPGSYPSPRATSA